MVMHMKFLGNTRLQRAMIPTLMALCISAVIAPVIAQNDAPATEVIITQRDYTVHDGDTFRSIAQKELGKIGLAPHLAEFNNLSLDAVLAAGATIQIPLYAVVEKEFATIVFIKGDVQREGASISRDDEVYINELLTTGDDGFVSMMFKSGSVVNLQPNTNVKLVKLNCLDEDDSCIVEIETDQGQISSDVESKENQETDFIISTPHATAAVRGTFYEVSVSPDSLTVGVTEGGVAIANETESLDLDTGFGSFTEAGKPLGQPVPLLPSPVYRYIPTRAAQGDRILWWNISDVDNYIAQITTDREGRAIVTDATGNDTNFAIDQLDAGEYFLNVRGVDSNGIKGYVSSTRITVAEIDPSLQPVDTEISFDGNEFLVSVIDPAEDAPGFEIQVSPDPEFDDPLSVDIGNQSAAVFRLDADKLYARARVLVDPTTVSAFGNIAESQ